MSDAEQAGREHELKAWPGFFAGLVDGTKTSEVRKNDRHFEVGDRLRLREFNAEAGEYTGRVEVRVISRVDDLRLITGVNGLVLLSFRDAELAGLRSESERRARVLTDLCDDLEGRFANRFIAHNDPYAIALGERTFEARRALAETKEPTE